MFRVVHVIVCHDRYVVCRAVMWHDGKHDVGVYFSDLKSLICPASVRSNVSDCFAISVLCSGHMVIVVSVLVDCHYVAGNRRVRNIVNEGSRIKGY